MGISTTDPAAGGGVRVTSIDWVLVFVPVQRHQGARLSVGWPGFPEEGCDLSSHHPLSLFPDTVWCQAPPALASSPSAVGGCWPLGQLPAEPLPSLSPGSQLRQIPPRVRKAFHYCRVLSSAPCLAQLLWPLQLLTTSLEPVSHHKASALCFLPPEAELGTGCP